MRAQSVIEKTGKQQPSAEAYGYRHILMAVDNSAHSDRGVEIGLSLAQAFGSEITGSHAYAAKLHDLRFKQMEGGLPVISGPNGLANSPVAAGWKPRWLAFTRRLPPAFHR